MVDPVLRSPTYTEALEHLQNFIGAVGTETVPLLRADGRVLAETVRAVRNIPGFDRSPYDGYAVRAEDTLSASRDTPVTLGVVETIPVGAVPTKAVSPGTAARIMTGAPIPTGADAVIQFEKTAFTAETVMLFRPLAAGENIVRADEDMAAGELLASPGDVIDAALLGVLASQGIGTVEVYRRPRVAVAATGDELTEPGDPLEAGEIYNSNGYTLCALAAKCGCEPVYGGILPDSAETISRFIAESAADCDGVLFSGGASVGDYDFAAEAIADAGAQILVHRMALKPGMACVYAVKNGRMIAALSGNPASMFTQFCAVTGPLLRKMSGMREYLPKIVRLTLADGYGKKSPVTRLLRGKLELSDGTGKIRISQKQGNVQLTSAVGCDAAVIVPAGSGALPPGTVLDGFLL